MNILIQSVIFLCSLALILKAADFLVSGASSFAKRMKVSEIAIGLTIVSFGTSMPEFVVNLYSSITGHNEIVFGNVIGSNIFNVFLILGISAFIYPIKVKRNTTWKEIPFAVFTSILLLVLVNDVFIDNSSENVLSRIDGIVLLIFFIMFIIYVISIAKVHSIESAQIPEFSSVRTVLYIVFGIAGLAVGGRLLTDSAIYMSRYFGLSEKFISIAVIATGTSLPELATSAVAAYRKNSDISVGNIIGSNIFNILFILGFGALIRDASFVSIMNVDAGIMAFSAILLFSFMFVGKAHTIERRQSLLFLASYVIYMIYLFVRK